MGSIEIPQAHELDVLIVGAGFNGIYGLKILRDAGYKVKLVEHGSDYGGTWYWNRYPGIRVDSPVPHYEFSDPDLWRDWQWQSRFPGGKEILAYFAHVAEKWDLRKDTQFDTYVSSAEWNEPDARWIVRTEPGTVYRAKCVFLCTGISAKRYIPDWKGIDSFKGRFTALAVVSWALT
jgi:cation diffusion facilitator CzcD-associated flavoprotein CzcO